MKKFLIITLIAILAACSSGISVNQLTARMPKNDRTFVVEIPAADNAVSNAMVVGMVKTSGSPSASNIIQALSMDNANIGVAGNSQMINRATTIYALQNAQKIGRNVALYMMGDSESDKADLEKAANSKNIQLHYFVNTK